MESKYPTLKGKFIVEKKLSRGKKKPFIWNFSRWFDTKKEAEKWIFAYHIYAWDNYQIVNYKGRVLTHRELPF